MAIKEFKSETNYKVPSGQVQAHTVEETSEQHHSWLPREKFLKEVALASAGTVATRQKYFFYSFSLASRKREKKANWRSLGFRTRRKNRNSA